MADASRGLEIAVYANTDDRNRFQIQLLRNKACLRLSPLQLTMILEVQECDLSIVIGKVCLFPIILQPTVLLVCDCDRL